MNRKFSSPVAFRQALEQRLKNLARRRGVPLQTLRLKLAIERLLARLFQPSRPPWLLKGGYAMELRYRPQARTTKDIDLSVSGPIGISDREVLMARIREDLQEVAAADLDDFMTYRIAEASMHLQGAPRGGARFPVESRMAGRVFERFHVDVGVGDALVGTPEQLLGDDLLEFAGIAPATARAVPRAQQFAEKIHAYTLPWTDRTNTRSKDLVDISLLLERDTPDPTAVKAALNATFTTRGSHPLPELLPQPPAAWASEYATMAEEIGLRAATLQAAYAVLSGYWMMNALGTFTE